MQLGVKNK